MPKNLKVLLCSSVCRREELTKTPYICVVFKRQHEKDISLISHFSDHSRHHFAYCTHLALFLVLQYWSTGLFNGNECAFEIVVEGLVDFVSVEFAVPTSVKVRVR